MIYIDMEDPANADLVTFKELSDRTKTSVNEGQRNSVFIDELQKVAEFEKALRFWVKQDGVDVVVMGSNAAMLSSDIANSFAGRYHRVHVSSLDYREFLLFNGLEDFDNAFLQYLRWGRLPFLYCIPLEIAKYLKGSSIAVSANTVAECMDALCDTYMIDRVKRYDIKGKSVFE